VVFSLFGPEEKDGRYHFAEHLSGSQVFATTFRTRHPLEQSRLSSPRKEEQVWVLDSYEQVSQSEKKERQKKFTRSLKVVRV